MAKDNWTQRIVKTLAPFEYRTVGVRMNGRDLVELPDGRRLSLEEWNAEHPNGTLIEIRITRGASA